jgi:hypothetical protein
VRFLEIVYDQHWLTVVVAVEQVDIIVGLWLEQGQDGADSCTLPLACSMLISFVNSRARTKLSASMQCALELTVGVLDDGESARWPYREC